MSVDQLKNFTVGYIKTPPSPASSGTTLIIDAQYADNFPDPSSDFGQYRLVVADRAIIQTPGSTEIVKVVSKSNPDGSTWTIGNDAKLTIIREQEGSQARAILEGDYIYQSPSAEQLNTLAHIALTGWIPLIQAATLSNVQEVAGEYIATLTTGSNYSGVFPVGMKGKFTDEGGAERYFIFKKISVTCQIAVDSEITAGDITNVEYSRQKTPQGFPKNFTLSYQNISLTSLMDLSQGSYFKATVSVDTSFTNISRNGNFWTLDLIIDDIEEEEIEITFINVTMFGLDELKHYGEVNTINFKNNGDDVEGYVLPKES